MQSMHYFGNYVKSSLFFAAWVPVDAHVIMGPVKVGEYWE